LGRHQARDRTTAYEQATADGAGAIAVDGKLVDEASCKLAAAVLARAQAGRPG
jgi:citrate lyase beta subunit